MQAGSMTPTFTVGSRLGDGGGGGLKKAGEVHRRAVEHRPPAAGQCGSAALPGQSRQWGIPVGGAPFK